MVYVASKSCSKVLGYSAIDSLRDKRWEKKEAKGSEEFLTPILRRPPFIVPYTCLKEPTNVVDKNAAALVHTNSHCKEVVVAHVQLELP